ncbi:MAG: AraC family transcriptional regulator [Acetatifactor sp.]|nr:AraC family transcriptional regulator [Acetatifactor sp.]
MLVNYSDLNIAFTIENVSFTVLNMAFEEFRRNIPMHSHSAQSYEVHYIAGGSGKAIINEQIFELLPNTLYVTGPGVKHEQLSTPENPMKEYCIYLHTEAMPRTKKATVASSFLQTSFWFGNASGNILPILQQLFEEMQQKHIGYRIIVESLLRQFLVAVVRCYVAGNRQTGIDNAGRSTVSLDTQRCYIIETYFLFEYTTITLHKLAESTGVSTRQLERFLKEQYGKTFLQMKNEARMSAAATLLSTTDKSITEISMELDYASPDAFSRAFRNFHHVSAREYRKNYSYIL